MVLSGSARVNSALMPFSTWSIPERRNLDVFAIMSPILRSPQALTAVTDSRLQAQQHARQCILKQGRVRSQHGRPRRRYPRSEKDIAAAVQASARTSAERLKVGAVDLLQIHGPVLRAPRPPAIAGSETCEGSRGERYVLRSVAEECKSLLRDSM